MRIRDLQQRVCDAHLVRAGRQSQAFCLCSLRGKKNLQRRLRRDERTDADICGVGLEATLRWRPGKMPEMLVGCSLCTQACSCNSSICTCAYECTQQYTEFHVHTHTLVRYWYET